MSYCGCLAGFISGTGVTREIERMHVNELWLYFSGFIFKTGNLQGSQ